MFRLGLMFGDYLHLVMVVGNAGESQLLRYLNLKGTGYKEVFAVQNASGNGLDAVARRPDGKYDIF